MTSEPSSAPKEANRLTKVLDAFHAVHGGDRYPVDVEKLALGCADLYQWSDPIAEVQAADIRRFDGGLFKDADSNRWLLLYNPSVARGRIRFTQAHELGHYILHRTERDEFRCSDADMLNWTDDERDIEAQADKFASYLLMPLHDFRTQVPSGAQVDLDLLGGCASRYGVSLTAAILKWLEHTEEKALVVHSIDGFMNWSWSSSAAMKAGAFFRTRANPVPLPTASIASDASIASERKGVEVAGTTWFPYADKAMSLREMKMASDRHGMTLTLLILPRYADVWKPRNDW